MPISNKKIYFPYMILWWCY